jgi:hypothetical protein
MRFFFLKCLEIFWGILEILPYLGKVLNVDFFSFLPQKIGYSEKSQCLKFSGILGILTLFNIYGHLINVEDIFHLCQKNLGTLKISSYFSKNSAV